MKLQNVLLLKQLLLAFLFLLLTACAAGDVQFTADRPADFWNGLWHGIISVITLIIHLFNDSVRVYEINNVGGWYDFGFLLGVIFIWGGGTHVSCKSSAEKKTDKEWDEVGTKVELKVMRKLKAWAEDEEGAESGEDWEKVGEKVERKLKRKLREWAEKD